MNKKFRIILKAGKEKPLLGKHPWVFSGAIKLIVGEPQPGDIVDVFSNDNKFLGTGYFNPATSIAIRILSFEERAIDCAFMEERMNSAVELRKRLIPSNTNAFRLINGEGDFLPGLVVDKYDSILVCQFLTAGMEKLKPMILDILIRQLHPQGIYSDGKQHSRKFEGLPMQSEIVYGEIPETIIEENGHKFMVNPIEGQKTGHFLDQRDNRLFASNLAKNCRTGLDAFCYAGAFSIYMLKAGLKSIVALENSESALAVAKRNLELNDIAETRCELVRADVFKKLREFSEKSFDIIILDPPALAKKEGDIRRASMGYKEINMQAFRMLTDGGYLCTFSCSAHIDFKLFTQIVFAALKDSGRQAQILKKAHHTIDHPQNLSHPEGEYLKGLFLKAL